MRLSHAINYAYSTLLASLFPKGLSVLHKGVDAQVQENDTLPHPECPSRRSAYYRATGEADTCCAYWARRCCTC